MGMMGNQMEATIMGLYWGNIGKMEKKMETTIEYRGLGYKAIGLAIELEVPWSFYV